MLFCCCVTEFPETRVLLSKDRSRIFRRLIVIHENRATISYIGDQFIHHRILIVRLENGFIFYNIHQFDSRETTLHGPTDVTWHLSTVKSLNIELLWKTVDASHVKVGGDLKLPEEGGLMHVFCNYISPFTFFLFSLRFGFFFKWK